MSAFDDYSLTLNHLTDVSEVDTKTTVLGHETSMHLILSSTGTSRLFHHEKEVAVAKAGVEKCLSIFQTELEHSMTLLGTQNIKDIKPEHLSKLNEPNV